MHNSLESEKSDIAIILAATGSVSQRAAKTYCDIASYFRSAFPGIAISLAYTSDKAIDSLKSSGFPISGVNETISNCIKRGCKAIVLQSLHIMRGDEFLSIADSTNTVHTVTGEPLLASDDDISKVAMIISSLCNDLTPAIIAAHGSSRCPEYNEPLIEIAAIIEKQHSNTVLCTLEGPPGTEPLNRIRSKVSTCGSVNIIPLMLTAGVHVTRDIAGEDASSWKNILGAEKAFTLPPLGEMDEIKNIFISHCKSALLKINPDFMNAQ